MKKEKLPTCHPPRFEDTSPGEKVTVHFYTSSHSVHDGNVTLYFRAWFGAAIKDFCKKDKSFMLSVTVPFSPNVYEEIHAEVKNKMAEYERMVISNTSPTSLDQHAVITVGPHAFGELSADDFQGLMRKFEEAVLSEFSREKATGLYNEEIENILKLEEQLEMRKNRAAGSLSPSEFEDLLKLHRVKKL